MARSYAELIDFLLVEIASTGQPGCTPNQILLFIHQFYAATANENGRVNESTEKVSGDPEPTIDGTFEEQIWALLTKHPDVSVGSDRSLNGLPLSDIEAIYAVDRERVTVSARRTHGVSETTDHGAAAMLVRKVSGVVEDKVFGTETSPRPSGKALDEVVASESVHDEFGFPQREQPTMQYRNGQASLEEGLKAANPSDFQPSAGDLIAIETGHGEYVVEDFSPHLAPENDDYCGACGDPGELLCCDGCPNAYHGACLEPPIDTNNLSEDQWYCPHCENNGTPNASTRDHAGGGFTNGTAIPLPASKATTTPQKTTAKKNLKTKPLGRPRKFLRGTEQFWRGQFSKAPALFARRPPNFDTTLLRALQNGMPTPTDPEDISQNWIEKTLAVLDRSAQGLYISPKGNLQRASRNRKAMSQVMILRSARLREVDFSDSHEVSAVRFLASNAAHTFSSLRYYPQAKIAACLSRPQVASFPKLRAGATLQTPVHPKGPKLGVFYEETHQQQNPKTNSSDAAPVTLRRNSGQSVSTIGSPICLNDTNSQSPANRPHPVFGGSSDPDPSQGHRPPKVGNGPAFADIANRLPPPLTTRAASRRQASTGDGLAGQGASVSQNTDTSAMLSAKLGTHLNPLLIKDQRRKRQPSDIDSSRSRPTKLGKKNSTGLSAAPSRQRIILDIIERCGGAIPDNSLLLSKVVTAAWRKSGEAGVLDKRTIDANLKSLCGAGKIKRSTFSFKDQRGFMVVNSILAKPEVGPMDPVMRQLQRDIVDIYPNHYIPSGMYEDQASQMEGNLGLQLGAQPQRRKGGPGRPRESTQLSPALQPIEDDASGPDKSVERLPITKEIATMVGAGSPPGGSVLRNASRRTSSSRTLNGGQKEDVSFLIRHEQPIVFDVRVPSRLSNSTAKPVEKQNQKVIWRKGRRARSLPRSLEDILQNRPYGEETNHPLTKSELHLNRFESEVDSVARWEERSFNRFQEKNDSESWNFISHFVDQQFEAAGMEKVLVQFNGLTWYDMSGRERLYTPEALKRLWAPLSDTPKSLAARPSIMPQQLDISKTTLSQTAPATKSPPRASTSQNVTSKKRKRKPAKTKPSKKKKAKQKPRKLRMIGVEPAYITKPDGTVVDVSGYINAPVKRARGTQHLRNMSEAAIYKLTVAIVVIRTLSGGLDKNIDWTIVMRIFPGEDLDFIHDRWKTIRTKFRQDIAALTDNLQARFCSAYIGGKVPDLDFDDIYNNDWEGIVEWAVQNLDKSCVNGIEDLPDTREELADAKIMTFEEHRGMREYLGYNVGSSLPVREAAQATTVFAQPVQFLTLRPPEFSSEVLEMEDDQLNIAKSWARATVLTPEGNFDAYACKQKLSKLANSSRASDALFDRALKSLTGEKTIFLDPEATSRIFGRGYKASKLFYDAIDTRRTIQAKILRQAARYKTDILDPTFRTGQQIAFQPNSVEDGDMVAILNLLASGRVRVQIGADVPKNRYGLLTADGTGTYQTRHLEKDRLSFTVLVEAVQGRYVYGNPLGIQLAPVPAVAECRTKAMPVWVDIHGNFLAELWELVVCAVIGLISTRPGINAKELVKILSPSLTLWETEIVLRWMKTSGLVEPSCRGKGQGWVTTEWWWLVCGGASGWQVGNLC